jgi:hypothetical protein
VHTATDTTTQPTHRDLALLRAVAAGKCELVNDCGPVLIVDGRCCCDQLLARRLTQTGLIDPPSGPDRAPARLTDAGEALLVAA